MRVVSLLPASTEIVAALGAGDQLVGISHECDWPPAVGDLPRVTRSAIAGAVGAGAVHAVSMDAAAVDELVRSRAASGEALFELLEDAIAALRPDVILTQCVCDVCAVSESEVRRMATHLSPVPRVLTLTGGTLDGVFQDIAAVADALGRGEPGAELLAMLRHRMRVVHEQLRGARAPRPRVAVIEWDDPPFAAGHWVPELIHRAGGLDVLARPGEHSRMVQPEAVEAAAPDVLIVAPCGYSLGQAAAAARHMLGRDVWRWARALPIWAMDANGLLSRGGPRLIDGLETIARVLHPSLFGAPGKGACRVHAEVDSSVHPA